MYNGSSGLLLRQQTMSLSSSTCSTTFLGSNTAVLQGLHTVHLGGKALAQRLILHCSTPDMTVAAGFLHSPPKQWLSNAGTPVQTHATGPTSGAAGW